MRTISAKSTKTIPTNMRSNKLSYFKCIKYDNTIYALKQAIRSATVTLNAPKLNDVTVIVRKVMNMRKTRILPKTLYSVVCDVLFAIFVNI